MSILKAQPFNATDTGAKSLNEQKIIFTGGVILETNVSDFIHSGIDDSQSKMKLGFSAGGFLDLGISKAFSVQGEMLFHHKNSDFEWSSQKGEYRVLGNGNSYLCNVPPLFFKDQPPTHRHRSLYRIRPGSYIQIQWNQTRPLPKRRHYETAGFTRFEYRFRH